METDISIIGTGTIGDKAQQLVEKTPALREIGFHTPRRVVLAEGFFDGFFQRNDLGQNLREARGEDLEKRIQRGTFTREEFETLQRVAGSYGTAPLAIRSSAAGDARGTGIYTTTFTPNQVDAVGASVLSVLASYFSAGAVAFRKDAHTGEGMGIFIEPIIGHRVNNKVLPVLSGFGYTSTSRGEGYINVVPGLGGGVETHGGEQLTRSALESIEGSLRKYVLKAIDPFSLKARQRTALLNLLGWDGCRAMVYGSNADGTGGVGTCDGLVFPDEVQGACDTLNLLPFFDMIARMEARFGKPQYFEWALTFNNGKPKYWITQIADADKNTDLLDFGDLGEILFTAHSVTNTGIRECSDIVYVPNYDHVEALNAFNQQHHNYLLLFPGRLNAGSRNVRGGLLDYSYYNNCSAILEKPYALHGDDPIAHWDGRVRETGKLFGVMDTEGEIPPNWKKFDSKRRDDDPIPIYHGRVKVIASERQNKMIVSALD